jgi:hypothetical protein
MPFVRQNVSEPAYGAGDEYDRAKNTDGSGCNESKKEQSSAGRKNNRP